MAYTTNTLNLLSSGSLDTTTGVQMWGYMSADASGTFTAAGYVTDAGKKGMRLGDIVWITNPAGPSLYVCLVTAITLGSGRPDQQQYTATGTLTASTALVT
jgi:hypothetical protein